MCISYTIDDCGRVIIPNAIRHNLAIAEGDNLSIQLIKDKIVCKKAEDSYSMLTVMVDSNKKIKLPSIFINSRFFKDVSEVVIEYLGDGSFSISGKY